MKIVYCIPGTYNAAGMERVLANKANYLAERGYDITIITTEQCGREPYFALNESIKCIDLGIGYESNNGASFFNKVFHYPFKQYRHRKLLSKALTEIKPDITISMFGHEAGFITKIKDGSHKILEIHFSRKKLIQYGRKGLWKLADQWRTFKNDKIVRRFESFVVLTESDAQMWGDLPNIAVIPNACVIKSDAMPSIDSHHAIAVGRYDYQKGFDRLIQAWEYVALKYPDWTLSIIGDGPDKKLLEKLIVEAGLSQSIKLMPNSQDIEPMYRSAAMLISSSRYEGLPMAMLEAQAYGLPIIAMDCECGPREIITNGVDGCLVPEGDTKELAHAICNFIENRDLAHEMSINAKASSLRYSEDTIMDKWMKIFDRCTR